MWWFKSILTFDVVPVARVMVTYARLIWSNFNATIYFPCLSI